MSGLKLNISNIIFKLYCLYLILAMCFASSQILRLFSLGVLAFMALLCGFQIVKSRNLKWSFVSKIYLLFVAFALCSCVWAVSIERSTAVMYELITSLAFVLIVDIDINTNQRLCKYIDGYLFASLCMCIVLLLGSSLNIMSLRSEGQNIIGLDKNYFSIAAAFATIITFSRYITTNKKIYLINIPIYVSVIIGSGSRKALLCIGLGIALMYGFVYRHNLKKMLKFLVAFCITIGAVIIYLARTNPDYFNRLVNGIIVFIFDDSTASDASASIRTLLIERAISLFLSNPVVGIGLNNFSYFSGDINVYGGYMYAHNNYVEILADFGIIGFFIYYTIYLKYFHILSKNRIIRNTNSFSMALSFSVVVLLLINDIASVSYYLKIYILLLLFAFKIVCVGVTCGEES